MSKLYLYNTGSHVLHIADACHYAKGPDLIGYDSEDEALQQHGRELGMCKNCMKKRDEILRDFFKNANIKLSQK